MSETTREMERKESIDRLYAELDTAREQASRAGYGIYLDAMEEVASEYDCTFWAYSINSDVVIAEMAIGIDHKLFCVFSERNWNVGISLDDSTCIMGFDFNTSDDFQMKIKGVIADYFLTHTSRFF